MEAQQADHALMKFCDYCFKKNTCKIILKNECRKLFQNSKTIFKSLSVMSCFVGHPVTSISFILKYYDSLLVF